jgi:hypothetical protein
MHFIMVRQAAAAGFLAWREWQWRRRQMSFITVIIEVQAAAKGFLASILLVRS